jgi:hypothetical protein
VPVHDLLTQEGAALTSGSHWSGEHGDVADFLAILSFIAFIAVFLGYIWCMERV